MNSREFLPCITSLVLLCASSLTIAADETFNLQHINITGSTLLPQGKLDKLVAPYLGTGKTFRDIQLALEAVEAAYREAGYSTVQVTLPEQELTKGTLELKVFESQLTSLKITGNKYFSEANIRATLPSLREGLSPNTRLLSENIQLANENPAKEIDVILGVGQAQDSLEAKVNVTDEDPFHVTLNADNTGTPTTGRHRVGVSLRHANLFNLDHTATLSYTTSPDLPSGTKVDVYSLGYRIPLYNMGDSIDFFYANSNINTPATTLTLGAFQNLTGRGEVTGIRWNHYFARQGEYTSKLVGGWDIKVVKSTCTDASGTPVVYGTSAGCTPYTVRPLSATYLGSLARPDLAVDFQAGYAYNLPVGTRYQYNTPGGDTGMDRYSLVSSNRQTPDHFSVVRLGGNISKPLPKEWLIRLSLNGQSSLGRSLVGSEQFGLTGSQAVRGFYERVIAVDTGYVANLELYAPNIADMFGLPGNLRPLAFYDTGRGWNYQTPSGIGSTPTQALSADSTGLGLRYNYKKDVSFRLDVANVLYAGSAATLTGPTRTTNNDWRGHFNLSIGF